MFENSQPQLFASYKMPSNQPHDPNPFAIQQAVQLYRRASIAGQISTLWAKLRRSSYFLLDLDQVRSTHKLGNAYHQGLRSVPIDQIRGSEGRWQDFDSSFHPLKQHNRSRWIQIATLRLLNHDLPPVELIQIEDRYFVFDGHHRVSVAKTMGQKHIDAILTVWQMQEPVSWKPIENAGNIRTTLA